VDPKLFYWSGALALMATMAWLVASGVRAVRRGDVARHRRRMGAAGALVAAFLVSYVAKVIVLGHEDLDAWESAARRVLYLHETFVTCLLLGGLTAAGLAWSFRGTRAVTRSAADPAPPAARLRWHRRAGWTAVVSAFGGLLTAALMLLGMLRRAEILS
jgi:uncharacterized membrane protein YozB (DUF420 family)